jgi:predicted secreted hydrolase
MLKIPSLDAALKITPSVKDQMLDVSVKYWEGAVRVEGLFRGSETKGKGYVELTGY